MPTSTTLRARRPGGGRPGRGRGAPRRAAIPQPDRLGRACPPAGRAALDARRLAGRGRRARPRTPEFVRRPRRDPGPARRPAPVPNLSRVVVAGHSGGGQVAQRYAMLSREGDALAGRGIAVSYVVANPSSYAYVTPERPGPTADCPGYDRWKYGLQDLPRYAGGAAPAALEAAYVARPVTYLLGGRDTDPHHPALDRSCMAETQGRSGLPAARPTGPPCGPVIPTCASRSTSCRASAMTAAGCSARPAASRPYSTRRAASRRERRHGSCQTPPDRSRCPGRAAQPPR